ncbi:MAG: amidase domain-containing protein [Bacillota bacterium]|nr:amidase domain-containing protein [Bacillota bacterium]
MLKNLLKPGIKTYICLICFTILISSGTASFASVLSSNDEEIKKEVEALFNARSSAFVTGDLSVLENNFDLSRKQGLWAKEHEIKRVKYLHDWASARGIKFTSVNSEIRIKKISPKGDLTKVVLEETYKFDYIYPKDLKPAANSFGVGIRHSLGLVKRNDRYLISHDWYTDCFEDALKAYDPSIKTIDLKKEPVFILNGRPRDAQYIPPQGRYNRTRAVQYADKYCGAANGEGNNFKYNKKYEDFNGIGGDCTNFASQVLGDLEGGELRQDGTWYCHTGKFIRGQGSSAWVNADNFRNYVLYSGKGALIKKGTFKDLALPTAEFPHGITDKLELGDLICYAKGSNMDHFAVVTSWDSHGYPLVNSHTTDRYHVPWDLGWGDKNIFFHLIRIR